MNYRYIPIFNYRLVNRTVLKKNERYTVPNKNPLDTKMRHKYFPKK